MFTRAGSSNHLAMPLALKLLMPLPLLMPLSSLNHFPERPREILEDYWHCKMTVTTELVGVFQVFSRSPIETLFKDRYIMSGSDKGSGIAK